MSDEAKQRQYAQHTQTALDGAKQLLSEAGHSGELCAMTGLSNALGPAGGLIYCKCGARMWTKDLLALRELRTGERSPWPGEHAEERS
jgi:hypothetical protein